MLRDVRSFCVGDYEHVMGWIYAMALGFREDLLCCGGFCCGTIENIERVYSVLILEGSCCWGFE